MTGYIYISFVSDSHHKFIHVLRSKDLVNTKYIYKLVSHYDLQPPTKCTYHVHPMLPDSRYKFEVAGKDRTYYCISGHFKVAGKDRTYYCISGHFKVAGKDRTYYCISGHFKPRHKTKYIGLDI